jgi:hypothetical protein
LSLNRCGSDVQHFEMNSKGVRPLSVQASAEIVGVDEVGEMPPQLIVIVVVITFDGRVLDRSVHPFDLTVGPGMIDLGEAVFDAVFTAT